MMWKDYFYKPCSMCGSDCDQPSLISCHIKYVKKEGEYTKVYTVDICKDCLESLPYKVIQPNYMFVRPWGPYVYLLDKDGLKSKALLLSCRDYWYERLGG